MQKSYEEILEEFSENLKVLRKKQGLSQEFVAGIELSVRNYQKIEAAISTPSLRTILIIADGLGIHPRELFDIPSLKNRPMVKEITTRNRKSAKKKTTKK
ncbi:helix-turn-helix domain-containing protein [Leptospira idonii]|uniref:XRE family transcriptional regulator n=1 Tax=Leptospira idonii TaxID=1193500 RepID=A0A4R9M3Q6_9LEPT|nr:helix-turn-helix transcriptional regulator [Leptospira idonii]TGN20515.1 XRE family transcriptional regulator [Leptospira idonii]